MERREPEVIVASTQHGSHAESIALAILAEVAAGAVGIALRPAALIRSKMEAGDAVIALAGAEWAGFCYLSAWESGKFVSTSGLIVRPPYRGRGLARRLKSLALDLGRRRYPGSRFFGLTTSEAVSSINRDLGFVSVSYSEITHDPEFWRGCESCPFHGILASSGGASCRCRAMLLK